jgi:AraC-like DNA-binding protein
MRRIQTYDCELQKYIKIYDCELQKYVKIYDCELQTQRCICKNLRLGEVAYVVDFQTKNIFFHRFLMQR